MEGKTKHNYQKVKPVKKLNLLHKFSALATVQLMFVVAGVESHLKVALQMLFLKTAAEHVRIICLEAPGFSQDRINLKVDHVGHLSLSRSDGDQLEHLLAFGVRVEHLHSILSCFLNLS